MAVKATELNPPKATYHGKFVDRHPDYPYAGMVSNVGRETVAECLIYPKNKPPTPDPCVRLRQWTTTPLEQHRIFHAQVNDPQLDRARSMVHGINYPQGPGAADLVNPVPQSVYQQRFSDRLESIYDSHKRKPLGHQPDPAKAFPDGFDYNEAVFGVKYKYNGNAKELLNPDISYANLHKKEISDHDTYLVSHKHFYPGEQAKRGYSAYPRFAKMDYFGMPTPCNREGLLTKACMRWHTDRADEKKTPLVDKRLDDFREKYTAQVGLPLDPIKDSMLVGPGHTFGMKSQPDLYKVEDLMHGKIPYYFNTGPNRQRAVMGAIRNHLRALHYNHYKDLHDACALLDTENTGLLPEDQLHAVCRQFDLPVDPQLLEQVFDICHEENNMIDWRKFTSNFNWQERVDFEQIHPDYSFSGDPCESNQADWNVQNRLQREVQKQLATWTTSNSMYNGGGVLKGKNFPRMGAPTVRTDLPVPKIRKATDRNSYGDEGGARCVINPSIMTIHGITEMDLLIPRSKQELNKLYDSMFPLEQHANRAPFELVWKLCSDLVSRADGQINIVVFKAALTEVENSRIRFEVQQQIPMLEGCLSDTGLLAYEH